MNEFNPTEQEYWTALWQETVKGKLSDTPIKFRCKEFVKSGRGTSQGQDSIGFTPTRGLEVDRKQINIWTTANYNFKKGDKVTFNGFKYEVHRVSLDVSSTNEVAMSEYASLVNSRKYLPFVLELGR